MPDKHICLQCFRHVVVKTGERRLTDKPIYRIK